MLAKYFTREFLCERLNKSAALNVLAKWAPNFEDLPDYDPQEK